MTALWTSLLEASEMFGDPASSDAVLVLSDFEDNVSKTKQAQLQKALIGKGVRGFDIGIFEHYFASQEVLIDPTNLTNLIDLARETGGTPMTTDSFKDAPSLLKRLFDGIAKFYVLRITSSVPLQKPEHLNLSVLAEGGKKAKGIGLSYPQHFLPCAVPR